MCGDRKTVLKTTKRKKVKKDLTDLSGAVEMERKRQTGTGPRQKETI